MATQLKIHWLSPKKRSFAVLNTFVAMPILRFMLINGDAAHRQQFIVEPKEEGYQFIINSI
jgi:hypothetical protein